MTDLERKIKVVLVSYLNTKPMLAGLSQSTLVDQIELIEADPKRCAQIIEAGEADIALMPVAAIPQIPDARIISKYCIGASGKVGSVCLFSQVPLDQVDTILLDYQSRTSVALCELLCEKFWSKKMTFKPTRPGYINDIKDNTAGLVIGDRTFELKNKMPFCYDLAEAWMEYSNLPFVFANWVSRVPLSNKFLKNFDEAIAFGLGQRPTLAKFWQNKFPQVNVLDYFTEKIDYVFNESKRIGLNRFYKEMGSAFLPEYLFPRQNIKS